MKQRVCQKAIALAMPFDGKHKPCQPVNEKRDCPILRHNAPGFGDSQTIFYNPPEILEILD